MLTDVPPSCAPCMRANVQSEGFSWCSDCEEILCDLCDRAHKIAKPSRNHCIIETTTLKEIPEKIPDFESCSVHQGKNLEGYCSFHDSMCCRSCMVDQHKTCERIESIEDVSKNIKSSALVEEVLRSVLTLQQTFEGFKENREKNRREVHEIIPTLKVAVGEFRANAVEHLNNLEMSLCKGLDSLGEEISAELDAELIKVEAMDSVVSKCKENLNFCIEYASNRKILLLLAKLKATVGDYERTMEKMFSKAVDFKVGLKTCDQVTETITSLASIDVGRLQCSVTFQSPVKSALSQLSPSLTGIKYKRMSDIKLPGESVITSIDITDDDTLLMCNYLQNKVIACTEDGFNYKEVVLCGQPYGIALRGTDQEAFVTLPHERCITVMNIIDLQEKRRIETDQRYFGIKFFNDIILVGGFCKVDFLSLDGICNRSIDLIEPFEELPQSIPDQKDVRFLQLKQNGQIICSNSEAVYCHNIVDGQQLFTYKTEGIIRGVALDIHGHLYIAVLLKKSIHKLSHDGEELGVLLDEKNGLLQPFAIHFSRDASRLYVTFRSSDFVAVFKCLS